MGRVEWRGGGVGRDVVCVEGWVVWEKDESVARGTGEWCGEEGDVVSGDELGSGRSIESWDVFGRVGESSE